MKNLLLGFLILNYASFALLCFASVISPESTTKLSAVTHNHHSHIGHELPSTSGCQVLNFDCTSNPIDIVLGHAGIYDSITSAELTSLGAVLLLALVFFVYWGGLYQSNINHSYLTWHQSVRTTIKFFFKQDLLAWSLLHTRSPNYYSS